MDNQGERELVRAYDAARQAGQRCIQERWRFLRPSTRVLLAASGFYSERGASAGNVVHNEFQMPEHDIERLEYALGVLSLCARSSLPGRIKEGTPIPREALEQEVPAQCEEVLVLPAWRDPEFLRLGLSAISQHEVAQLLMLKGPSRPGSVAVGCLGAIVYAVLLLLSPIALGGALVSAAQGDIVRTVVALYGVALCALAVMWAKKRAAGEDVSEHQRHYSLWLQFKVLHSGATIGAGAQHYLGQMAAKGVLVPAVAFDLCAALQATK